MEILRFEPIYQERVWGGQTLATAFGRALPAGRAIGESWEIVDRPEAQSIVPDGPYSGHTLRQLIESHGRDVMGPQWPAGRPFPILVKWLDCRERLSLQVHPPADQAPALGGEPKTENWFIAGAAPGAALIVGLRPGVTRAQFERALASGMLETCVNRFPVAAGDSILVRSGTVHAIDAGNLILEIQQNSDTTYRVYDWGRTGLDHQPRPLHLREALASILWDQPEARAIARRRHARGAGGLRRVPHPARAPGPRGELDVCRRAAAAAAARGGWSGAGARHGTGAGTRRQRPAAVCRPVCLHRDRGQPSARDGKLHLKDHERIAPSITAGRHRI